MKIKCILILFLVFSVNVYPIECRKGIFGIILDTSISFMQNLRRQYQLYFDRDDHKVSTHSSDMGEGDRSLRIVGDGSSYVLVQTNKSFDGGKTYELISDYVEEKGNSSSRQTNVIMKPKGHSISETSYETPDEQLDPLELMDVTTESDGEYPTNMNDIYPSNKDGAYGYVVQLSNDKRVHFMRPRGEEVLHRVKVLLFFTNSFQKVYYFEKIGKSFKFLNEMVTIRNNGKKLPPDITAIFRGPEGLYYFIREDAYCRRPLNVSGIGLDPPDYCPEGEDLRELMGCNLRFYPPEVDDLCNNPLLDHSLLAPDNRTAWLFRGKDVWLLHNLPTNPKASPSKCNMTKGMDANKIWTDFELKSDALFLIENEGKQKAELVQFKRHKFKVWNWKGGKPLYEGYIKEMPLERNHYRGRKKIFTEKPVKERHMKDSIVYTEQHFKELCQNPRIDSADSNLDGSQIVLFKDQYYYVLTGVKDNGVGKLTKFGKSEEIYEKFHNKSIAVMTTKEGKHRGHFKEYYAHKLKNSDKYNIRYIGWDINKKVHHFDKEAVDIETKELAEDVGGAAFHNRNITDPVMVVLKGDDVFYFSTVGEEFVRKRRQLKYFETEEKFPPGVDAAFSMPDQILYLFRDKHYCVRQLFYNSRPPYCPEWYDSRELFGCYGDNIIRTTTPAPKPLNDRKALKELCSDVNIDDADMSWQREHMLYVWRGNQFWLIDDFPHNARVVRSGPSAKEWDTFSGSPDAVTIIQEGQLRRGWVYAMYGRHWSSWYPDNKPWVGYKAWWGQPTRSSKFNAMMHNGNINNPLVIGFEGSQIYTYSSDGTVLEHKNSTNVEDSAENWPRDVTAAFRMYDNTVYLFRGNMFCKRHWNCLDKTTNCCNQWKDAKELFNCHFVNNYSVDDSEPNTTEEYVANVHNNSGSDGRDESKSNERNDNLKPNQILPTPKTVTNGSEEIKS